MECKNCGNEIEKGDKFCLNCGKPIVEETNSSMQAPSYTQNKQHPNNEKSPFGLTSFVLAIISMFLPVPYLDIGVGIAAIVFAILSYSKETKRGFAIAGLVLGILAVIGAVTLLMDNGYEDIFEQITMLHPLILDQ